MKNKKLSTIIHRVIDWLFTQHNIIVNAQPTHCDIHLNSSAAIGIWLAMIDRPCKPFGIAPWIVESHNTYSDIIKTIDRPHSDVTTSHMDVGGGRADDKKE